MDSHPRTTAVREVFRTVLFTQYLQYGTIKYNLETIWALGVEQRRAQSRWSSVSRVLAGAQAGVI